MQESRDEFSCALDEKQAQIELAQPQDRQVDDGTLLTMYENVANANKNGMENKFNSYLNQQRQKVHDKQRGW